MADQEMQPVSGGEQTREKAKQQAGGRGSGSSGGGSHGARRRFQQHQSRRPEPSLNMEELRELFDLIGSHGFTDFELEREGFRVRVRRDLTPHPTGAVTPPPAAHYGPQSVSAQYHSAFAPDGQSPAAASGTTSAAHTATAAAEVPAETGRSKDEDLHIITSPIVGTFYRSPSPTAEPFVRAGSSVEPDTVVCIIEAMKLMNEIQAETSGVVEKIYVENGQPVEYGQPLFGIRR